MSQILRRGDADNTAMRKGLHKSTGISITMGLAPTTNKLHCYCYFNACRQQAGLMGMSTMHVDLNNICSYACEQSHPEGAKRKAMATLQLVEHKAGTSDHPAGTTDVADSLQEVELPEGYKGQRPADEHPGHHDEHCPAQLAATAEQMEDTCRTPNEEGSVMSRNGCLEAPLLLVDSLWTEAGMQAGAGWKLSAAAI